MTNNEVSNQFFGEREFRQSVVRNVPVWKWNILNWIDVFIVNAFISITRQERTNHNLLLIASISVSISIRFTQ